MNILTAAVCALAVAAPAPSTVVTDAVHDLVEAGYPAAIAYARNGEQVDRAAAGYADLKAHKRATPAHRFRIASNTKAFTSAVVLQLVAEKRIRLDEPIETYLPGTRPGITVRQLLNHTSGLYDPTTDRAFWKPYLDEPVNRGFVYRPKDIVANAMAQPPTAPPGTKHDYSNTNYLVAGLVIEAVTGKSAVSQIYRRIVRPLHLAHTTFPTVDPRLHGRYLHGYDLDRNDMTVFSPSYDWTAGAIVSTVDDLARFHRALFDGTLLGPAQLAELKKTVPDGRGGEYGLGVERRVLPCPNGTVPVWGNTGGGPGFNSLSLVNEDTSRQLVLAMNTYDIEADLAHKPPVPPANPMPALAGTFCPKP